MKHNCTTCSNRDCSIYRINRRSDCSDYKPNHDILMAIFGAAMFAFALGLVPYLIHLAKGGMP